MIISFLVITSTIAIFNNQQDAIFMAKGWDENIAYCEENFKWYGQDGDTYPCYHRSKIFGLDCQFTNDFIFRMIDSSEILPQPCTFREMKISKTKPEEYLEPK